MTGPGYDLPNVPYTMYFYQGYGLHGTYWHNNFGTPMSHGCVNMPTPERAGPLMGRRRDERDRRAVTAWHDRRRTQKAG